MSSELHDKLKNYSLMMDDYFMKRVNLKEPLHVGDNENGKIYCIAFEFNEGDRKLVLDLTLDTHQMDFCGTMYDQQKVTFVYVNADGSLHEIYEESGTLFENVLELVDASITKEGVKKQFDVQVKIKEISDKFATKKSITWDERLFRKLDDIRHAKMQMLMYKVAIDTEELKEMVEMGETEWLKFQAKISRQLITLFDELDLEDEK